MLRFFIGFLLTSFMLIEFIQGETSAQTDTHDWSDTVIVATNASAPVIAADTKGGMHLFYVEGTYDLGLESSEQAIMYMSGVGTEWSRPIDVLVSPNRSAINVDAVEIDADGYLHLLWNDSQSLYHSVVHLEQANSPLAWRTDHILDGQIPVGDMALDEDGTIHAVVRDTFFTVGYLRSQDGGFTWLDFTQIQAVDDRERYAIDGIKLALSDDGMLYTTWFYTAAEVRWNLWSVWFGRSTDNGQSWNEPSEMATPRFGDSDIAIDGQGNLHLVYGRNIGSPDGRWHQWSQDGGETWSLPESLYPQFEYASGLTGGFGFATDSAGVLHLVNSFGNTVGDASAYHMFWQGDRWSSPQMLLDTSTHAHHPRLTITLGNQLQFFAFSDNVAENGILYRTGLADAPSIEPQAIPAQAHRITSSVPQPTMAQSNPEEVAVDQQLPLDIDRRPPPPPSPLSNPLLLGLMPVLAIIIVTVLFRRSPFRSR